MPPVATTPTAATPMVSLDTSRSAALFIGFPPTHGGRPASQQKGRRRGCVQPLAGLSGAGEPVRVAAKSQEFAEQAAQIYAKPSSLQAFNADIVEQFRANRGSIVSGPLAGAPLLLMTVDGALVPL